MRLTGLDGYYIVFSVESDCDSVLLINTAATNWFYDDDDNGASDPLIRLTNPSTGVYDIWVGTYNGRYCDAVLSLETFDD